MSAPTTEHLPLPAVAPGNSRHLTVLRFGRPGARPKAYVQASLHADEIPGMLVAHHLRAGLEAAAAAGRLRGEVVLVPFANPIGLTQHVLAEHLGRYALESASNFNRHFPDLAPTAAERLAGRLGDDPVANVATVRAALAEALAATTADDEVQALRRTLLGLALDADIVLDLHCDLEAVLHLYLGTPLWPDAADLAADLGAEATLLARVSGGEPFDEAVGGPWWALADAFPDHPIPAACLAATVELRGVADVSDTLAATDAAGILRFLTRRGVLTGDPGPLPELRADATPLEGVEMLRAPVAGVLVHHRAPGEWVDAGDPVATIVDPGAARLGTSRTELLAGTSGRVYGRVAGRFVRPGTVVSKIAGATALAGRAAGALLPD